MYVYEACVLRVNAAAGPHLALYVVYVCTFFFLYTIDEKKPSRLDTLHSRLDCLCQCYSSLSVGDDAGGPGTTPAQQAIQEPSGIIENTPKVIPA
jgi:hypothetical protein